LACQDHFSRNLFAFLFFYLYYQVVSSAASALPKYRQIFENLRDAINSGRYSPGQRLPSEAELVNVFGASRITVIRALRELQTQGIIERRAGSGSYVRKVAKAGHTFGLLIPELGQTEIFEPICGGMARAPHMERHALLWGRSLADSAAKESEARDLCRQLIAKKVSGVFFAPLELTAGKDTTNRSIAEVFDEARIPIVLLDRDLVAYPERSRYDLIGIDNRRAGYVMTKHLLGLGCKRVAFLGRPRSAPTVDARIAGYREAVLDAEVEFDPQFIARIEPWDKEQVKDILHRLRPDGIVCANDYTAGQLMRTFNELSVAVPDQIRVTGMDDVKYASLLPVPLTTLHQPCAEIGATAVAHMIQRLEDPSLPARDTLLDFHIVVRRSCGSKGTH
jgi:GntR family transcriptional regulator of arabinose operon